MNIYFRELKAIRKSLLLWCIGMLFMIGASMAKYAAGVAAGGMDDIMAKMPAGLQALFGVGMLDYSKVSGFYAMIYIYLVFMAAIHASMLSAVIISKEERDRTSEFLFVKPVTRAGVITAKLMASLTSVVVLNLVTWVLSVSLTGHYGNGEDVSAGIAKLMLGMFLVQLLFLSIGSAAAALLKRPKGSTGIATAVMLATFILSIAIDVNGKIDWMKFLTPFKYFDAKELIYGQAYHPVYIIITVVVTAALGYATYWLFKRRDLRV